MQVMMTLNTGTSPAQQAKPQLPMKNLTAIIALTERMSYLRGEQRVLQWEFR